MYNRVGSFTWRMGLLFLGLALWSWAGQPSSHPQAPRGDRESCETSHCQGPLRI